jgi:hypothetical protein
MRGTAPLGVLLVLGCSSESGVGEPSGAETRVSVPLQALPGADRFEQYTAANRNAYYQDSVEGTGSVAFLLPALMGGQIVTAVTATWQNPSNERAPVEFMPAVTLYRQGVQSGQSFSGSTADLVATQSDLTSSSDAYRVNHEITLSDIFEPAVGDSTLLVKFTGELGENAVPCGILMALSVTVRE